MEKYLVCLTDAISSINKTYDEGFLDTYISIEVDIKLLINDADYRNTYYTKIEKAYDFNRMDITTEKDILVLKSFVSAIYHALKNNTYEMTKFMPLVVFIDETNILLEYLIQERFYKESDLENAKNLLSNISAQSNIGMVSSSNWEVDSYKEYIKGQKEENIHKVYKFFEVYERSRFTFNNEVLSFYSFILFKVDFDAFIQVIDGKKDVILTATLLAKFSLNDKFTIAEKSNDKLLKFEVIRKAVVNNQVTLSSKDKIRIANLIFDVSFHKDFYSQLLKYFLIYPTRTPKLSEPLALFLNKASFINIDLFINNIKFSTSTLNGERPFYNQLYNALDEKSKIILGRKIFEKSLSKLDYYDEFISGIVIFELFDIVLYYAENFIDKDVLFQNLDDCLGGMSEINNKWFVSSTEQQNYFYKIMTKVFIFSFPFRDEKYYESLHELRNLINDNFLIQMERQDQNKTIKALFEEYI